MADTLRTQFAASGTRNRKKKFHSAKLLALGTVLLALSFPVEAQQPAKMPKLGWLAAASSTSTLNDAFRQGLRELGYVEGKNIVIEHRWAEKADHLSSLAAELVRLKVDLILATGVNPTRAAKQATSTIPIVMGNAGSSWSSISRRPSGSA